MKKTLAILTVLISSLAALAAENNNSDDKIYTLEIDVVETQTTGDVITREDMDRDNAYDLWEAVRYTPGVILSGGGRRDDSSFTVRGFGADSVPVFVDGIVIANPYKGDGDAARILTGDLESVTIQKGYSSMLLGANTLGGAVLMNTAKPKKEFEARIDATFETDSIYKHSASYYLTSVGTKQDKFYLKATAQYRDIDHFRLSDDFEPKISNPQKSGERLFSDSTDTKYTLLAGITPSQSLDIWATYTLLDSDKGVSPPETDIQNYLLWDWTNWKRESVSLSGSYSSGKFTLDAMAHYDKYDNSLIEYYNMPSYEAGVSTPPSDYDEYTAGGRITAGWMFNTKNRIQAAATFKREQHTGLRNDKKEIYIKEDTISLGAEYTFNPVSNLTLVAGIGYDALQPQEYWGKSNDFAQLIGEKEFVVKTEDQWLVTGQLGVFYEFIKDHELRLTYARKNHFPTMSQRYSTRFGRELPNPKLLPEVADHYELGYKGDFGKIRLNTAIYYSQLDDKIVTMEIPNPSHPSSLVDYTVNLDKVSFYGFEVGTEVFLNRYIGGGAAFSVNKYTMDESSDKTVNEINYYPEITANGYMIIAPTDKLSIIPRAEYIDSRYADTEGDEVLDSYVLAHIKVSYDINRYMSVSGSVTNIFDEYYEIKQFYPQAGRTFSLTLSAKY
ncbi:TonB-dependent receptor [Geovibrio sp. ADMFC3]